MTSAAPSSSRSAVGEVGGNLVVCPADRKWSSEGRSRARRRRRRQPEQPSWYRGAARRRRERRLPRCPRLRDRRLRRRPSRRRRRRIEATVHVQQHEDAVVVIESDDVERRVAVHVGELHADDLDSRVDLLEACGELAAAVAGENGDTALSVPTTMSAFPSGACTDAEPMRRSQPEVGVCGSSSTHVELARRLRERSVLLPEVDQHLRRFRLIATSRRDRRRSRRRGGTPARRHPPPTTSQARSRRIDRGELRPRGYAGEKGRKQDCGRTDPPALEMTIEVPPFTFGSPPRNSDRPTRVQRAASPDLPLDAQENRSTSWSNRAPGLPSSGRRTITVE